MEPIIISASFFQEQPSLGVLGRTGEHEARRISFDCSEVLKTWPEATILCVCRRPCDTAAYPISLTADGTTYTMPLMSRETAAAGTIKLELRAVRDDTVLKSAIFYGRILPSLNGQKDAPGNPLSDALNRLESTIANAQTLADEIRQKLDNGEFVGERGPQGEPGKDGSDANVTAENIQSALGYAPVKDVQVAGSSVLDGGVANVPIASKTKEGVIKAPFSEFGIQLNNDSRPFVSAASEADITARQTFYRPLVPARIDYAVKAAMCDGKGAAWTSDEQKAARERMGVDKAYELIEEITLTENVKQIERFNFGYGVSSLMGCVELPVVTNPFGLFMRALWDGDSYVTGYAFGLKEAESSIRFELAIHNGIIMDQCQGNGKGWGSGIIYGINNAASLKYCDKITGVTFYAPEADAVIPANAIVRIYGVRA